MDNEMIERCKLELEHYFSPAINFKAPYAKVMSDMAIKAIIKSMREPTEKMKNTNSDAEHYWKAMIDAITND